MKFEKNVITISGRKTYYWQKGLLDLPVVVFLHGFPGNHAGLLSLARGFGEGYRLIIPDMPACGESEPLLQNHILENYAKWLVDFLLALSRVEGGQLQLDKIILVGHSFGARTALVFASRYRQKLEKLVLITPVMKVDGLIARIASLKGTIAKFLPAALQKIWLKNRLYQMAVRVIIFKSASKKRREEISRLDAKELSHLSPDATLELFDEFYRSDLMMLAKSIALPCLVVASDRDEVAPLATLQDLASKLPRATLSVMQNSGHLVPLERPRATAKIILDFLNLEI